MAFSLESWSYNEVLSAAKMNRQVRDNLAALWVGAAAGDMDYYASATTKQRVALGGRGLVMRVNPAGNAPEWGGLAHALVRHNTTQSIPSSTTDYTTLLFNTEDSDDYSLAGTNGVITIPDTMPGLWMFAAGCYLAANSAGTMELKIDMGGTDVATDKKDAFLSSDFHKMTCFGAAVIATSRVVTAKLFQNSGSSLNASNHWLFAVLISKAG